jgi:hypothetical protein
MRLKYQILRTKDASPTDTSRPYLTVIDDSTRDVANKISKPKYILDSGANRHFFKSTVTLHEHAPNVFKR